MIEACEKTSDIHRVKKREARASCKPEMGWIEHIFEKRKKMLQKKAQDFEEEDFGYKIYDKTSY